MDMQQQNEDLPTLGGSAFAVQMVAKLTHARTADKVSAMRALRNCPPDKLKARAVWIEMRSEASQWAIETRLGATNHPVKSIRAHPDTIHLLSEHSYAWLDDVDGGVRLLNTRIPLVMDEGIHFGAFILTGGPLKPAVVGADLAQGKPDHRDPESKSPYGVGNGPVRRERS